MALGTFHITKCHLVYLFVITMGRRQSVPDVNIVPVPPINQKRFVCISLCQSISHLAIVYLDGLQESISVGRYIQY